jgi:hypothetical protein
MTDLAPIRLVRSRIINSPTHGQVRVVVDLIPEVNVYQVCTEIVDSGELVFGEIFSTLPEATATLGARFNRIANRATAEKRSAQEGEAA